MHFIWMQEHTLFTFFLVESMKNARHNTVKLYFGAKKVIHKVLLAKNVAFLGTGCSVLLKKLKKLDEWGQKKNCQAWKKNVQQMNSIWMSRR